MESSVSTILLGLGVAAAGIFTAIRVSVAFADPAVLHDLHKAGTSRDRAIRSVLDLPIRTALPLSVLHSIALVWVTAAALSGASWSSVIEWLGLMGVVAFALLVVDGAAGVVGMAKADQIVIATAKPLYLLVKLSGPLNWVGARLGGRFRHRERVYSGDRLVPDEIQVTVMEGSEQRVIDEIAPAEKEMIAGIIELKDTSAREIMVPRIDVVALEATARVGEALNTIVQYGHSRLPLYEGNIDHIVGLLHAKDLVRVLRVERRDVSLQDLARPAYFVPEAARLSDLLKDLQRRRIHMAIVVDEYGGTAGVVTIEDVLEEIVGEIQDEYDAGEEAPVELISPTAAVFSSRVAVEEVNGTLGLNLPEAVSDTIGGLVYHELGKIPKVGDTLQMPDAKVTVTAVSGRRIRQVRIEKSEQTAPSSKMEGLDEPEGRRNEA